MVKNRVTTALQGCELSVKFCRSTKPEDQSNSEFWRNTTGYGISEGYRNLVAVTARVNITGHFSRSTVFQAIAISSDHAEEDGTLGVRL